MKISQLSGVTVKRTVRYKWEQYDEKLGENANQEFDLDIWFKRDKLNQKGFSGIRATDDAEKKAAVFKPILLDSIEKWSLDDPVSAETLDLLPFDLLVAVIEAFNGLITINPTKPAN